MRAYVTKRFVAALVVLFVDALLVFFLIHLTPGDPALMLVGGERTVAGGPQVETVRQRLGLDKPLHLQLVGYFQGLSRGDLGTSFFSNRPVRDMLASTIPPTFLLALISLVVALVIALPTGILAALKRGSVWDQAFMLLALFGVSVPSFWLGLVLMLAFAVHLRWFPVVGTSFGTPGDWVRNLTLPAVAVGFSQSALIARMTRASLLEVLQKDYVALTARAKGLARSRVILRHALPNAMFPIITVTGMSFAYLLGGVVVIETVFALPGMGNLMINAVARRDYQVVQGVLLFIAGLNVFMNFAVDMAYALIDKRIKYA